MRKRLNLRNQDMGGNKPLVIAEIPENIKLKEIPGVIAHLKYNGADAIATNPNEKSRDVLHGIVTSSNEVGFPLIMNTGNYLKVRELSNGTIYTSTFKEDLNIADAIIIEPEKPSHYSGTIREARKEYAGLIVVPYHPWMNGDLSIIERIAEGKNNLAVMYDGNINWVTPQHVDKVKQLSQGLTLPVIYKVRNIGTTSHDLVTEIADAGASGFIVPLRNPDELDLVGKVKSSLRDIPVLSQNGSVPYFSQHP